jgi:hypothetical protein
LFHDIEFLVISIGRHASISTTSRLDAVLATQRVLCFVDLAEAHGRAALNGTRPHNIPDLTINSPHDMSSTPPRRQAGRRLQCAVCTRHFTKKEHLQVRFVDLVTFSLTDSLHPAS